MKGCNQKKGIGFDIELSLDIEQLDVKTTFLHGDLKKEIYINQPEGFEEPDKEHLVCHLKKSFYGLNQTPRRWYKKFDSFIIQHNFKKTFAYHYVFVKKYDNDESIILLLYVDNMLIAGNDNIKIVALKKALSKCFSMKDLV